MSSRPTPGPADEAPEAAPLADEDDDNFHDEGAGPDPDAPADETGDPG